jgi:hypothetical protein
VPALWSDGLPREGARAVSSRLPAGWILLDATTCATREPTPGSQLLPSGVTLLGGRSSTRRTSSGNDRDAWHAGDLQVSRRGPESSYRVSSLREPRGAVVAMVVFYFFIDIFLFFLPNMTVIASKYTLNGE